MPFTRAAGEFQTIGTFEVGNAQLITIDAENVLTPYRDPTIYAESLVVLDGLTRANQGYVQRHLAVATNNQDPDYILELQEQIPDIKVFSAIKHASKKKSPDMFLAACAEYGIPPARSLHIDDQYLSFNGAKLARFSEGVLVKPTGRNGHSGVKLGRLLDTTLRASLGAKQAVHSYYTDGIDH